MREKYAVLAAVCAVHVYGDLRVIVSTIRVDIWSQTRPRADVDHVDDHHVSSVALCSPPSTPLRVFAVTLVPMRRALTAAARSASSRHLRDGRQRMLG